MLPFTRPISAGPSWGEPRWCSQRYSRVNYSPYLKNFYERVKARRGVGKAMITLARKFLGIIDRTLKNQRVFEDFPNSC
jgi:hypothetical protein